MKKYVLKRLLSLIPTIFIVSVVIFLLVHLTPGDPAAAMLGEDATAAEIAALHTQLGLDDPLVVQYFRWVGNCLRLDFGTSTAVVNKPVSEMIASHFQPTILLAIYSQLITIRLRFRAECWRRRSAARLPITLCRCCRCWAFRCRAS